MSGRGALAEEAAAEFLKERGFSSLERNYSCRFGEIDLIMRDGHTLVFVEVRYRRNKSFGGAIESITVAKRQKAVARRPALHGGQTGISGVPLRCGVA